MAKKVRPINLDKAFTEVLNEFGEECYTVMGAAITEVSDEAVNKLQSVAHFAPGGHPSGDYSKDWTKDVFPKERLKVKMVVHNLDHYRLTHLLENGHVSRNGTGRTFGRVPAYPHIAPVNDWANAELPKRVKEKLGR